MPTCTTIPPARKFEIVSGYKGTPDISLAMERGEVDGICGWDWSSVKSQKRDWIARQEAQLLVQVALEPEAELTKLGVPSIWKYVSDEDRKAAELVISQQVFQRSYIAPPGTPDEEIDILRKAFDETMVGPAIPGGRRESEDLDHARCPAPRCRR